MIECTRFSERYDVTWLPGVILTDHRGWALGAGEPYAKVIKFGRDTWSALVVCHEGRRQHLTGHEMTARQVYQWAASSLREEITGGREEDLLET